MKKLHPLLILFCLWISHSIDVLGQDPRQATDISVIEWSPTDQHIAIGTVDGNVTIFNESQQVIQQIAAHPDRVFSLEFSANEEQILTASQEGVIKLWNISDGVLVQSYVGHNERVFRAIFTSDGQQILSVGSLAVQDNTRIWDRATGSQLSSQQNNGGLIDLDYAPDGSSIMGTGLAGYISMLSPSAFDTMSFIDLVEPIRSARWSTDGQHYVVGFRNGDVKVYDSISHTPLHSFKGSDSTNYDVFDRSIIWDVAFNAAGTEVASIGFDGTLRRWDLATGNTILDTQIADTVFEAKFDSTRVSASLQ